jgi:hypothetical protein
VKGPQIIANTPSSGIMGPRSPLLFLCFLACGVSDQLRHGLLNTAIWCLHQRPKATRSPDLKLELPHHELNTPSFFISTLPQVLYCTNMELTEKSALQAQTECPLSEILATQSIPEF